MEIHGAWRKPSKQKVCTENLSLQDQQVAGLTFTPFTWGIPVSTGAGKPPWHFLFPLALKLRWFQVPDFSGNWILWVNFCPQLPFQMLIGKQFDWFAPSFRAWRKASLSGGVYSRLCRPLAWCPSDGLAAGAAPSTAAAQRLCAPLFWSSAVGRGGSATSAAARRPTVSAPKSWCGAAKREA